VVSVTDPSGRILDFLDRNLRGFMSQNTDARQSNLCTICLPAPASPELNSLKVVISFAILHIYISPNGLAQRYSS
jgi:hypothetical protein